MKPRQLFRDRELVSLRAPPAAADGAAWEWSLEAVMAISAPDCACAVLAGCPGLDTPQASV